MTHCSHLYLNAPNLFVPNVVSFVVSFLYSFPYIVKSKFGNYTTLNALVEQQRVQGGTFDPRVLTDGCLSKSQDLSMPHDRESRQPDQ